MDQYDSYATGSEAQVPIVLDADGVKGPLKEWVATVEVATSIKQSFRAFLETCVLSLSCCCVCVCRADVLEVFVVTIL
jgi:hypothetical protein